jgi:DNA-binding NarL/FixJ family response regulator
MICNFTGTPCRYKECPLWREDQQVCRFVLAIDKILSLDTTRAAAVLTTRELKILSLVARGYTNSEIGNALGVSTWTARNHVRNILSKLNVNSRGKAANYALRQGLVSLEIEEK